MLTAGLIAGAAWILYRRHVPETTVWGIVISVLSLATMWFLYRAKLHAGRRLQSDAVVADANCTKTCFWLSGVLLVSSGLYEWLGIGFFDVAGSVGIAVFAWREGREAFEKTRGRNFF